MCLWHAKFLWLVLRGEAVLINSYLFRNLIFHPLNPQIFYSSKLSIMTNCIRFTCVLLWCIFMNSALHSQCEAGLILTSDSTDLIYTCPGDGIADSVIFISSGNSSDPIQLVLANFADIILGYPNGLEFNFEPSGDGLARIYAVSYQDVINKPTGVPISSVNFSDSCFDLSSNFVTVIRDQADAGSITANGGIDTLTFCTGDNMDDNVLLEVSGISAALFSYVITDQNNTVLEFPDTNALNFEGVESGICKIWSISWTGNQLIGIGDDLLNDPISDDCSDISENNITIIRNFTDGGSVSTVDNQNEVFTCEGDSINDIVLFRTTTTAQTNYVFVITDQNDVIVALSASANFNFEGTGFGIFKVYGLSYTGALLISSNISIFDNQLATGCFGISDNFIEVVKDRPMIGFVNNPGSQSDTSQLCLANGNASVRISVDGLSNTPFRFIITDTNAVVLGFSDTTIINFDGAGEGVCNVWGVAYTGDFIIEVGDNLDSTDVSDDCYELSENFLQFIRTNINVGTIESNADNDVFVTCPGDGVPDFIMVNAQTTVPDSQYTFIVTDTNFAIIDITDNSTLNFDDAPEGTCLIWGLAYQNSLLAEVGMRADRDQLAEGCFALTPNFIEVIRENPSGGNVSTTDGENQVFVCNQDQMADIVTFQKSNTSNGAYRYIITDENNVILSLPIGNSADFNDAPIGTCRIWGLAFTGDFTASVGDLAVVSDLSSDCFDLSDNFIEIIRARPLGGAVFTVDDEKEVNICVGDGNADFIEFKGTANSDANYTFAITDEDGIVLEVLENNFQNFEGVEAGVCLVYGISYTGNLTNFTGQNINTASLSDDCFDLSTTSVQVNRFDSGSTCNTSTVDLALLNQSFTVYPNPASEKLYFNNSSNIRVNEISILQNNGSVLQSLDLTSNSHNIEDLSSGVYFIKVQSEYGNIFKKLVIL